MKDATVYVRLTQEQRQQVEAEAERNSVTMRVVVRWALERYFDKHSEHQHQHTTERRN